MAAIASWQHGRKAQVLEIPVKKNGKVQDYEYHSVVRIDDSEIINAANELIGYDDGGEWWAPLGHCCEHCALGQPCTDECKRKRGKL